jgi:hypothetical protein
MVAREQAIGSTRVGRKNPSNSLGAETVPVEIQPRWRPSEDAIVRGAIAVILVALVSIIALAAAAVLTMG